MAESSIRTFGDSMREIVYEDYEPDIPIWPYVLLSLIIPAIPFLGNMLPLIRSGSAGVVHYLWNISSAFAIFLFFSTTSKVIRTGEGSSQYIAECIYWVSITICQWAYNSYMGKTGFVLGIPLALALAPSMIFLLAYAFYRKRRRIANGIAVNFIAMLLSSLLAFFLIHDFKGDSFSILLFSSYPIVLSLIALSTFLTTGRSIGTPFFVSLMLVASAVVSLFLYGDFRAIKDVLQGLSSSQMIRQIGYYFSKSFTESYMLYLSFSSIIVFDALARKSSYRNYESGMPIDSEEDDVAYEEAPRMPIREDIPRAPVKEEYHSPIEDERVRKEFEEWKEYRRLTTARPTAQAVPEENPKLESEEKGDDEYNAAASLGDIKRRKFGEEQDLDSNDKWYELLRGEIPDEEFNVRR